MVGGVTGLIVGGGIGGTCGALKEGFLEFHPFAGPRRNAAYARVLGEGGGCKRDSKQYTDADPAGDEKRFVSRWWATWFSM